MTIYQPHPVAALSEFEGARRFWDPRWKRFSIKVKPGEYYVSGDDVVFSTVLGSCISACIYDPVAGLGGLNHFMLPDGDSGNDNNRPLRYGFFAMEQLINELMKHGCLRERMQVKVTGGGDMMGGVTNIGQKNIDFVLQYIDDEGLPLVASDLGGNQARRVAYFPVAGRMLVNKLDHRGDMFLLEEEQTYRDVVDQRLDKTDVELF